MKPYYISENFLKEFTQSALREDVGEADHSTLASVPPDCPAIAKLLIKESGIVAGIELAGVIFSEVDPLLNVSSAIGDGEAVTKGDVAFTVSGKARSILVAERLVLNCMQRMSGIATRTHQLNELIKGTNARLLDTRKTTPGFRLLEKWAVLIGGGKNHRLGLYDMVMLKDNHIAIAGGVKEAINRTKDYLRANNKNLRIEIEAKTLEEVKDVLETGGVDMIMLDNMNPEQLRKAVDLINGKFKTEASGNITETTIRNVAETGVDYISVGALTHSVKSLDMSLKIFTK